MMTTAKTISINVNQIINRYRVIQIARSSQSQRRPTMTLNETEITFVTDICVK